MSLIYGIADQNGHPITDGLEEHEAQIVAQRIANELGEAVELCAHEAERSWPNGELVYPQTDRRTS